MATWNGVPFETFQTIKEQNGFDDNTAIRFLDDALKGKAYFAYHLMSSQSTMLNLYTEAKLPNSLAHRYYPSMSEKGYHDADGIMFFERELTGGERMRKALSLQEEDVQTPPVQETKSLFSVERSPEELKELTIAITEREINTTKDAKLKEALQVGLMSLNGDGYGTIARSLKSEEASQTWAIPRRKKYVSYMRERHGLNVEPLMPSRPNPKSHT